MSTVPRRSPTSSRRLVAGEPAPDQGRLQRLAGAEARLLGRRRRGRHVFRRAHGQRRARVDGHGRPAEDDERRRGRRR